MYKLLPFFLSILAFSSCKQSLPSAKDEVETPVPTTLNFDTDARLEVLYLAFMMAEYPLVSKQESSYLLSAKEHFKAYSEHNAVTLLKTMMYKGFNFDYAVNWLYQHADFPEFEANRNVNFPFSERPLNPDSLNLLRQELINFYTDTRCAEFLSGQKAFLDGMIASAETKYKRKDIMDFITQYFGVPLGGSYQVVLSPLLHSGGFAIERKDVSEFSALIGPSGLENTMPLFDEVTLEHDLVIHEFSHNYTNPIVDDYMEQATPYQDVLYLPYKEDIKSEGYDSFEGFMRELIVRATTLRIAELTYGPAAAQVLLEYDESVGFVHLKEVATTLQYYEKNRDQYPTLRDFYPEMIKCFKTLGTTDSSKREGQ